jgi:hypothetical protein
VGRLVMGRFGSVMLWFSLVGCLGVLRYVSQRLV